MAKRRRCTSFISHILIYHHHPPRQQQKNYHLLLNNCLESCKDAANQLQCYVEDDQLTPIDLEIYGTIPSYCAGTLYRTGPCKNKLKDTARGDFSLSHWFDGFSSVHRFEIAPSATSTNTNGMKVTYNSRTNVDILIEKIRSTGRYEQLTFGQKRDPCDGLFKKFKTAFTIPRGQDAEESNIGVTIAPDVPGMETVMGAPDYKRISTSLLDVPAPHGDPGTKENGSAEPKKTGRFKTLTAFTDSTGFKHLDPETLEPLGVASQASLHPDLSGPFGAAHTNFDPVTGDAYNHNLDFTFPNPTYRIFSTSRATGETEILATIKDVDAACAYLHSSFITENFFILAIWSSHMRAGGLGVLWERNVLDAIQPFSPSKKTIWLVIDRKYGRGLVAKYESHAAFSFHNSNAWEEEGPDGTVSLVLDCVEYANLDIIHKFYYKNFMGSSPDAPAYNRDHKEGIESHYCRYRLSGVPITEEIIAPIKMKEAEVLKRYDAPLVGEFPTINHLYFTRPNKYLYTIPDTGKSTFMDSVTKIDLDTGHTKSFYRKHHTPGEPIMVPNPEGTEEDDGVLLIVMLDGDKGSSYLAVVDCKTMEEVGRAEVGRVVPYGFHGRHIRVSGQSSGPAAESG